MIEEFRLPSTSLISLLTAVKQDNVFVLPESKLQNVVPTEVLQASYLGTPIVHYLKIEAGSYTTADGTIKNYPALFLDAVVMSVSQRKNIVKTPVFGRKGTFKEYISDGDFDVNIQGVLHGQTRDIPEEYVRTLKQICDAPTAIRVNSPFLELFDIYDLVIENYSFSQERAGKINVQIFEISCISDIPFVLVKE